MAEAKTSTEETKEEPSKEKESSSSSEESKPPPKTNFATGNNWICKGCGFSNDISEWNCKACYASMKKSIQRDKTLERKKQKEQNMRAQKRQAKRAKVYSKVEDKNKKSESDTQTEEKKSVEQTETYKLETDLPKTMRALVKEKAGKGYELRGDYPRPTPAEDELLIRSFAVAICGSDSILYNWSKDAQTIAKLPFIPGHETAGLVVGAGKDCRFRLGDRVAIENHFYCGKCYQCSINRKDICANLQQFGHGKGTIYGGCCEYFVCKERYCYKLKANISWRDAALLEPLGVAYNACERADLNERIMVKDGSNGNKSKVLKETVLIVGCGSIGCMAIGVAKTMIATDKIIAVDIYDSKLAVAKTMGADIVINAKNLKNKTLSEEVLSLTNGVGVGRVIECSGNAQTISNVFKCVRKGGAVTLVGLPKTPLTFEDPMTDLIFKSIQIRSIHGRRIFKTWNKTERLVSSNKIDLSPLVTHEFGLSEFEKGYEALASGKALKVVFNLMKK